MLVVDAQNPLEKQDMTIAQHVAEEGRALIICVNKWDVIENRTEVLQDIAHRLKHSLSQLPEVPVVTLSGQTYVSRFGASGLKTLGLDELIAGSRDEYRQIAVALAHDPARLGALRSTLRARMAASPLLDFKTFTRNLEAEYRRMWRAWCASAAGQSTGKAGG